MAAETSQIANPTTRPQQRPLKVGLHLPVCEPMMSGRTLAWADLLEIARLAEDVGFDSLWVADHLLFRSDGRVEGAWECWSTLTALATVTKRVEIGSLVCCLPFRNPALVAKTADTVDEISGGRLILGLGAGWNAAEFRAVGAPFDHRVGRFAEALHITHTLLKEGAVDFTGQYFEARECELKPRGQRAKGPPIMVGAVAHRKRMLRLVARYADLWNGYSTQAGPPPLAHWQTAVDGACTAARRDPTSLKRTLLVRIDVLGMEGRPLGQRAHLSGSLQDLAHAIHAYSREGICHLQIWLHPNTLAGIEAFAPVLDLLDQGWSADTSLHS
jgi:alkanesulfonate monooxygenase SsuD/methylene tetrahydromethanopterin reductase-like flavin-dependent oxidoreductase (luciferase family)